ncbi:MAG TPA: proteasome accessory factor PafA2 family protein, partial [Vicinamibacteria bacterium]|nr:proteasome accessory factor PafA2 family protein [Vicinamibacteria bacterium]
EAGFPGKLGLLKNCKDAEGHVYGAQESFEVEAARGASLWLYRLSLLLLAPLLVVTVAAGWGIVIVLVLGVIVAAACWTLAAVAFPLRLRGWLEGLVARNDRNFENRVGRWLYWLSYVITWPFIVSQSLLLRCLVFSRMRRELTAFLVSRAVLSGAGSVEADGRFVLSEKGASIRRVSRRSISPNDRAIFDVGNLMKPAHSAVHFYVRPFLGLFHRKQRLQLGLADSNVLDEAEFLKMGTTALVVDMVEAGRLKNVPRVRRPVRALHAIVSDPGLSVKVPTTRGEMSALEIQRSCLEEAKSFVRESKPTSLEARTVVRLWEDVLSALEKGEQDRLVGRIDWVTKRYLLEACGGPGTDRRLKTIDLRYHEIGDGYAARLVSSGHARKLISEEEVEHATTEPPMGTPAFARGRFIRERRTSLVPVRVAWDAARIGGRLHGKIVRFPGANG